MTILQGQDAWHQLDRWNEPWADRPTAPPSSSWRRACYRTGSPSPSPTKRQTSSGSRRPGRPGPAREPVERLPGRRQTRATHPLWRLRLLPDVSTSVRCQHVETSKPRPRRPGASLTAGPSCADQRGRECRSMLARIAGETAMRLRDTIGDGSIILPTALRRQLEQPRFDAAMFTPTRFATAAEKADFARHFVRFLAEGMPRLGSRRKSTTDQHHLRAYCSFSVSSGYYEHFFADVAGKLRFLEQTLGWWPVGDPAWTFARRRARAAKADPTRLGPVALPVPAPGQPPDLTSTKPARAPSGARSAHRSIPLA